MAADTEITMNPVLGHTEPDFVGQLLGTGYQRFRSPTGCEGLAKEKDNRLDVLAVVATTEKTGQFRNFVAMAQEQYQTICVWHDWNPVIGPALERYWFTPETEIDGLTNEKMVGWRWDRK